MHSSDLGVDVAYSASAAVKEFTERLTGASLHNRSGPEFFESEKNLFNVNFKRKRCETAIFPEIRTTLPLTQIVRKPVVHALQVDVRSSSRKMSFQLLKAGEILSKDGWAEHEVARWYFVKMKN